MRLGMRLGIFVAFAGVCYWIYSLRRYCYAPTEHEARRWKMHCMKALILVVASATIALELFAE
jgi:hypothetical protein